jgi:hypothetical protein
MTTTTNADYERGRQEMRDEILAFLNQAAARLTIDGRRKLADRYHKTADVLAREFGRAEVER